MGTDEGLKQSQKVYKLYNNKIYVLQSAILPWDWRFCIPQYWNFSPSSLQTNLFNPAINFQLYDY